MIKKLFISIIFIVAFTYITRAQDYNFRLMLEGIRYDSLLITGLDINNDVVKIQGISQDRQNWYFSIPDSIYNSVGFFYLFSRRMDKKTQTSYNIRIQTTNQQDTLNYYNILSLDRNLKEIQAKYLGQEIRENELIVKLGSNNEEDVFFGTLYTDKLLIPYYKNTELAIQANYPNFGSGGFYTATEIEPSYNDYVKQYKNIIEKYPDSRYLISQIAINLYQYKTKEDLQELYNAFSEVNQQTSWGKIIHNYIKNYYTFSDTILPTWDTGNFEPIIQDSTKINLVIFSASWCTPCHEQIPLLKEIYNDLKEYVDITYVSEDEPKYVDSWRKLMQKENIPWRSLLAVNDVTAIKKKYNAVSIPYILLVYPNKHVETIDVRIKKDKDKLYSLCGK